MIKYLLITLIVFSLPTYAQINKCTNEDGKITYTDQECSGGEAERITVTPNILPSQIKLEETSAKVIYEGTKLGSRSRFIRVAIYEETDEYMIFEIVGYHGGSEGGKVDFRVLPNIPWRAQGFTTTERGLNKGYTRVSLNSKGVDGQKSDIISFQLWYYSPQGKSKFLNSKTIPYKKVWKKPTQK